MDLNKLAALGALYFITLTQFGRVGCSVHIILNQTDCTPGTTDKKFFSLIVTNLST